MYCSVASRTTQPKETFLSLAISLRVWYSSVGKLTDILAVLPSSAVFFLDLVAMVGAPIKRCTTIHHIGDYRNICLSFNEIHRSGMTTPSKIKV